MSSIDTLKLLKESRLWRDSGLRLRSRVPEWFEEAANLPDVKEVFSCEDKWSQIRDKYIDGERERFSEESGQRIICEARWLLDGFYVYLPQKKENGFDPIRALDELQPPDSVEKLYDFHVAMLRVFKALRDTHATYWMPGAFRRWLAVLPFLIEACYEDGQDEPRYVVTHSAISHLGFQPGVRVLKWNDHPIEEAIKIRAREEFGAHEEASRALALARMTARWLGDSEMPAPRVTLTYETEGPVAELSLDWFLVELTHSVPLDPIHVVARNQRLLESIDEILWNAKLDKLQTWRRILAARSYAEEQAGAARSADPNGSDWTAHPVEEADLAGDAETLSKLSMLSRTLSIHIVVRHGDGKACTYIRLRSFDIRTDLFESVLKPFVVSSDLSTGSDGLVIDIRENPGGDTRVARILLGLLSTPALPKFQLRPTDRIEELCTGDDTPVGRARERLYGRWRDSLGEADARPDFSAALDLEDETHGVALRPLVVVTDSLTSSAAEVFAAGVQSSGLGRILGVNSRSTAGAVATKLELDDAFFLLARDAEPAADLSVALQRGVVCPPGADVVPLEGAGVKADEVYRTTRADVAARPGNRDLIAAACDYCMDQARVSTVGGQP